MGNEHPDDDALVARIAVGEEAAFRLLVDRWQQPVFAFLFHMLGSVEDAEDLAQETFVRVHRQAGRYRAQGRFRSWLFRIAGNLARSALRRRRILRWVRLDPQQYDLPDPGAAADRRVAEGELRRTVLEALRELPDRQREAVVLRRYQDLSHREIAEILGTTPAGVEGLLHRAMGALRAGLAGKVDLP